MLETDVFHMDLQGIPIVRCGETDLLWKLQSPKDAQSPWRSEYVIGVRAVWSLLEAIKTAFSLQPV